MNRARRRRGEVAAFPRHKLEDAAGFANERAFLPGPRRPRGMVLISIWDESMEFQNFGKVTRGDACFIGSHMVVNSAIDLGDGDETKGA